MGDVRVTIGAEGVKKDKRGMSEIWALSEEHQRTLKGHYRAG